MYLSYSVKNFQNKLHFELRNHPIIYTTSINEHMSISDNKANLYALPDKIKKRAFIKNSF